MSIKFFDKDNNNALIGYLWPTWDVKLYRNDGTNVKTLDTIIFNDKILYKKAYNFNVTQQIVSGSGASSLGNYNVVFSRTNCAFPGNPNDTDIPYRGRIADFSIMAKEYGPSNTTTTINKTVFEGDKIDVLVLRQTSPDIYEPSKSTDVLFYNNPEFSKTSYIEIGRSDVTFGIDDFKYVQFYDPEIEIINESNAQFYINQYSSNSSLTYKVKYDIRTESCDGSLTKNGSKITDTDYLEQLIADKVSDIVNGAKSYTSPAADAWLNVKGNTTTKKALYFSNTSQHPANGFYRMYIHRYVDGYADICYGDKYYDFYLSGGAIIPVVFKPTFSNYNLSADGILKFKLSNLNPRWVHCLIKVQGTENCNVMIDVFNERLKSCLDIFNVQEDGSVEFEYPVCRPYDETKKKGKVLAEAWFFPTLTLDTDTSDTDIDIDFSAFEDANGATYKYKSLVITQKTEVVASGLYRVIDHCFNPRDDLYKRITTPKTSSWTSRYVFSDPLPTDSGKMHPKAGQIENVSLHLVIPYVTWTNLFEKPPRVDYGYLRADAFGDDYSNFNFRQKWKTCADQFAISVIRFLCWPFWLPFWMPVLDTQDPQGFDANERIKFCVVFDNMNKNDEDHSLYAYADMLIK